MLASHSLQIAHSTLLELEKCVHKHISPPPGGRQHVQHSVAFEHWTWPQMGEDQSWVGMNHPGTLQSAPHPSKKKSALMAAAERLKGYICSELPLFVYNAQTGELTPACWCERCSQPLLQPASCQRIYSLATQVVFLSNESVFKQIQFSCLHHISQFISNNVLSITLQLHFPCYLFCNIFYAMLVMRGFDSLKTWSLSKI